MGQAYWNFDAAAAAARDEQIDSQQTVEPVPGAVGVAEIAEADELEVNANFH